MKRKKIQLAFITFLSAFLIPDQEANAQLKFIPNEGQWHNKVEYRAQLSHARFFLEDKGFTYAFLDGEKVQKSHRTKALKGEIPGHAVKVRFKGADEVSNFHEKHPSEEYYNFYLGRDPSGWASHLFAFDTIVYNDLYPHTDLEVTSIQNSLKYNFRVRPDGKAENIKLKYQGADNLSIKDGHLQIKTSVNKFRELAPKAYQYINGQKKLIPCRYELEDNVLSFVFPEGYRDDKPLIIDPKVIFSTFSGSNSDNFGYSGTFDSLGRAYSAGTVFGPNFPVRGGPFQTSWGGGVSDSFVGSGNARDVGILKYNDSGTDALYVTYLGGSKNEDPHSLIVNSEQDLLVFGNTGSGDFPMAGNPYQDSLRGNYDIFLAKISEDGTVLKNSTFLGGSDRDGLNGMQVRGGNRSPLGFNYGDLFRGEVIVDSQDQVLIASTTKSQNFPATNGAFQTQFKGGSQDACIAKFNSDLSKLKYASFWGSKKQDAGFSLTLAPNGDILFTGGTAGNNFSHSLSGYQKQNNGGTAEGYVMRIKPNFSSVVASTLLGTNAYDQSYFVQTDRKGDVYITGQTKSNAFPTKNANYTTNKGKQFVSKFNPDLDSLLLSTTFGSGKRKAPSLSPAAFLVDQCGRIFFSGWGGGSNYQGFTDGLDVTNNAFDTTTDGSDFYLAVFAKNMDRLLYGTYYGGQKSFEHVDGGTSRFDENSIVYQSICAGCGGFSDLPTTQNAWSTVNNGTRPDGDTTGCNNALLKLKLDVEDLFAKMNVPETSCKKEAVKFKNNSDFGKSYLWYFGDGDTSHNKNPSHKYGQTGKYQVTLVAKNKFSCKYRDTATDSITIYSDAGAKITSDTGECKNVREFSYQGAYGNTFLWKFGDSSQKDTSKSPVHVYDDTGTYRVRCIVDSGTDCADTAYDTVTIKQVSRPDFNFSIDTCKGAVTFINQTQNADQYLWKFGDGRDSFQRKKDTLTHLYNYSDTFEPALITDTHKTCTDTVKKRFTLKSPDGKFDYVISDSCQFRVRFINHSAFADTLTWYLNGDTLKSVKDTLSHDFPGPGLYDVTLMVQGPRNICSDTIDKQLILDTLPHAGFAYNKSLCASSINVNRKDSNTSHLTWEVLDTAGPYDSVHKSLKNQQLFIPEPRKPFIVRQVAEPNSQCADTLDKKVELDSAANAAFEYRLDTCQRKVVFDNQSTMNINYQWDFGDTRKSSKFEPVHVYSSSSTFDVILKTRDKGCKDSVKKPINIPLQPDAGFTFNQFQCSNRVRFNDQSRFASEKILKFGDGKEVSTGDTTHFYQDTGTFKISMIAEGPGKCIDTANKTLKLDSFAFADFKQVKPNCSGKVKFTIPSDSIGDYKWRFGDGSGSDAQSPVHYYSNSDTFPVRLIHRMNGCVDTAYDSVANLIPDADFILKRGSCSPIVRFKNYSENFDRLLWTFDDGDSSRKKEPIKEYGDTGTYEVRLIVSQNGGCKDTMKKIAGLPDFVKARFDINKFDCEPSVTFKRETARADSVIWLGLNGINQNGKTDSFTYDFEQGGQYSVSLLAFNEECSDTFTRELNVDSSVNADFELKHDSCMAWVKLEQNSTGARTHKWYFGDGNNSTKPNPKHFYPGNGHYEITYLVNEGLKCTDTLTKEVAIEGASFEEFEVPNVFTPNGDGINDFFTVGGLNGCKNYSMHIYNRWGQLVYEWEGQGNFRWDGKDQGNGNPLASGTYYYKLKTNNFKKTGTVTLIRNP